MTGVKPGQAAQEVQFPCTEIRVKSISPADIWSMSADGELKKKGYILLGFDDVQSVRSLPTFRGNVPPPASVYRSKSSKETGVRKQ
jgi:hypothetical protein